jgi:hypothetical protein
MGQNQSSLLNGQDNIYQKVNNLIAVGTAAVTCDAACQAQRLTDSYYKAYQDAQTTLNTAPQNLDTAYKNYIINSQGQAAYNQIVEKSLTSQVAKIAQDLSTNFFGAMADAVALNDAYNASLTNYNNSQELYSNYEATNKGLQNKIDNASNDIYTNDRKSYYNSQEIGGMMKWHIVFRWIYIIVLVSFVLCMFFVKSLFRVRTQVYIFIALFSYPFLARPVLLYLFGVLQWIGAQFPRNVYLNEAPNRDPNEQRDDVERAVAVSSS